MKKMLIPNKNFLKNIYLFDIEYDNILFNDIMLFIEFYPFIRNLKNCEIMLIITKFSRLILIRLKKTNLYKCRHEYEKLCVNRRYLSRVYNFHINWPLYEPQILIRESSNKFNKTVSYLKICFFFTTFTRKILKEEK